ncbi:hypothetical protein EV401DRAFT_1207212 [Pisolithus croceorrhizus]|nr:hypothetical protein EV401DRAFT_1207212 [Pisolithus croceorrhizus]
MRIFKASPTFKELVSSMTRGLDNERILRVVARFSRYVMFSDVCGGDEPLFQNVNADKSVWSLPDMPLNKELHNFCKKARRLSHNLVWSDTRCIDRATSTIFNQSLTSMYKWYADSAVTLILLADVAQPSRPGDLARSSWMTRAWNLQELLAPKVLFFYDSEWKPYLGITGANYKESQEIMQELADTITISPRTIVMFSPDYLGVREELRPASTRDATVKDGVAYSLIGIFKSDIRPHCGEGADTLGHLLEEMVARFGEVTVLKWTGKSSSYNGCLPASVSVYSQTPRNPPSLEGEEMEIYIADLRGKLLQREALSIYRKINSLLPTRFAVRRLCLPCIVFPVRRPGIQELRRGDENLYRARVSGLGHVEFTTADDLSLHEPQTFVFVHPWICHIQGPSSGVAWGNDSGSDSDSDSESGGVAPLHTVPVPQISSYARALLPRAAVQRVASHTAAEWRIQEGRRR